jgi:hypothetical protein
MLYGEEAVGRLGSWGLGFKGVWGVWSFWGVCVFLGFKY